MTIKQAIELMTEMVEYWEELIAEEGKNPYSSTGTEIELEALRMAVRALEERNHRAMESKPRWIPCSERLPETHEVVDYTGRYEESDLVLICDASGLHPQVHVGRCWTVGDKTWWRSREWKVLDKVVAWMPLPEEHSGSEQE